MSLADNDRSEISNQKYSNDKYISTKIIVAKCQNHKDQVSNYGYVLLIDVFFLFIAVVFFSRLDTK